jgi:Family of unknown function (DUF6529)
VAQRLFNRPVTTTAVAPQRRPAWHLFIPLLGGLFVAETLGIVARELVVSPNAYPGPWFRLFFSDTLHLKAWLALGAAVLGVTQLFTAAWIFRQLPWARPRFVNVVHRWSGRLAFALTVPVAYHCVFKLGFQTYSTRVAVHSFFGVSVYGAFATKVLIVRMHRFPKWVLPVAGGLLFAALIGAWWTSSFWYLRQVGGGT